MLTIKIIFVIVGLGGTFIFGFLFGELHQLTLQMKEGKRRLDELQDRLNALKAELKLT